MLEDNAVLREKLAGMNLPQIHKYKVPSDGYGKFERGANNYIMA